ncbi:MAG: hypothetical protein N4A33_04340 [Bacteriovoracaceae bacterium]|nr:hypothetical protein [Bacteriovoracaceae bacterium]
MKKLFIGLLVLGSFSSFALDHYCADSFELIKKENIKKMKKTEIVGTATFLTMVGPLIADYKLHNLENENGNIDLLKEVYSSLEEEKVSSSLKVLQQKLLDVSSILIADDIIEEFLINNKDTDYFCQKVEGKYNKINNRFLKKMAKYLGAVENSRRVYEFSWTCAAKLGSGIEETYSASSNDRKIAKRLAKQKCSEKTSKKCRNISHCIDNRTGALYQRF